MACRDRRQAHQAGCAMTCFGQRSCEHRTCKGGNSMHARCVPLALQREINALIILHGWAQRSCVYTPARVSRFAGRDMVIGPLFPSSKPADSEVCDGQT